MIDFESIERETRERWRNGSFLEYGVKPLLIECPCLASIAQAIPWIPYETYMMAQLIAATPGQVGLLRIKFPPDAAEDNQMHIHPDSDRVVTVLGGKGRFVAVLPDGSIYGPELKVWDRIWMPRGVLHTFYSGPDPSPLEVESIHSPFRAFDDPRCLVYPHEQ